MAGPRQGADVPGTGTFQTDYTSTRDVSNSGRTSYIIERLAAMQERSAALLRVQRSTERAISGVQEMKSQLRHERRAKREREIAFLQSCAAPLVERLVDLRDESAVDNTATAAGAIDQADNGASGCSAVAEDEGLRAIVREALQRGREAQQAGVMQSSRLCLGTNIQRSACHGKMRIVLDASYCGLRLERYAIILQRQPAAAEQVPLMPLRSIDSSEVHHTSQQSPVCKRRAYDASSGRNTTMTDEGQGDDVPLINGDAQLSHNVAKSRVGGEHGERGGTEASRSTTQVRWLVLEHSLPKFVPVPQLAARLLPANLRLFVAQVKDYVQAFTSRREQWRELLRLYSATPAASTATLAPGMPCAELPSDKFCILDPQSSDAYDQLSFTIHAARTGEKTRTRVEGGAVKFRLQLVFEDLRRSVVSSARIQGLDTKGRGPPSNGDDMECVLHCSSAELKRVEAMMASHGQRLATSVPRVAEIVSVYFGKPD